MFKISKGYAPNTFKVSCFNYIKEANFYTFLYSMDNKTDMEVVSALQGRMSSADDIGWAIDIARLTKCDAVIGNDGKLKTVPVTHHRKEDNHDIHNREGDH